MEPSLPFAALPDLPIVITPGGTPPINFTITIHQYRAWRGFGPLPQDGLLRSNLVVYIDDQRIGDDNSHYRNNLYFLDPVLYPTLPPAFNHDKGRITFFAHTPDFPGVMALLANGRVVWMMSKGGQVSLLSGGQVIA